MTGLRQRVLFLGVAALFMLAMPPMRSEAQVDTGATIHVGDPAVDGGFIKPYKNLWKLTYARPDKEPVDAARWSDEVELVKLDGRTVLKRTQTVKYNKGDIVTTLVNICDPKTMSAISRHYRRNNGTFVHIDFDGTTATYRRLETPGGEIKEGRVKLETPVFDFFGGLYGLLLTAFPLKEGYTAALPSYDEGKDALRWAKFHVARRERVEAGVGKQVEAWVVETDDHGPMTFWLTKEAPHIIKLVYVYPNGLTATYTMM